MSIDNDITINVPTPTYNLLSINDLTNIIINNVNKVHFTNVYCIGKPGSGKTTLLTSVINSLKKHPNVLILYLNKAEILSFFFHKELNINKFDILYDKRYDTIFLCLDDVSYLLDQIKDQTIKYAVFNRFISLRHEYLKKIIIWSNVHYKTALKPVLRDTDLIIYTSLSDEEYNKQRQLKNPKLSLYLSKYKYYSSYIYYLDKTFTLKVRYKVKPNDYDDITELINPKLLYDNVNNVNDIEDELEEEDDVKYGFISISGNRRLAFTKISSTYYFILYHVYDILKIDNPNAYFLTQYPNMQFLTNQLLSEEDYDKTDLINIVTRLKHLFKLRSKLEDELEEEDDNNQII